MSFYYRLSGPKYNQSELRVYIDRIAHDYQPGKEAWFDYRSLGEKWNYAKVMLMLEKGSKVNFEGKLRDAKNLGDLDLDDITLGKC